MDKDNVPIKVIRVKRNKFASTTKGRPTANTHLGTEITVGEYWSRSLYRIVPWHLLNPGRLVVKSVRQPSVLEEHNYHKRPTVKTMVRKRMYWLRSPPSSVASPKPFSLSADRQRQHNEKPSSSLSSSSICGQLQKSEQQQNASFSEIEELSRNFGSLNTCARGSSVAENDHSSYLDEKQGIRFRRLFTVPEGDWSAVRRICGELGGAMVAHYSGVGNNNNPIVFGCALARQNDGDEIGGCPFRLIYLPQRRAIYGHTDHKHAHLFVNAINNSCVAEVKEELEIEQEDREMIRDGQREKGGQNEEERREVKEELEIEQEGREMIRNGQREKGEQHEEERSEEVVRERKKYQKNRELIADGNQEIVDQQNAGHPNYADFDQMLNLWLSDGWLFLAHMHKLSDFVDLCIRHTLRQVQNDDHLSNAAIPSSSSTMHNFCSEVIICLECEFYSVNKLPNNSQTTASLWCPFRALFSRRQQTAYCGAAWHNHPLNVLDHEEAVKQAIAGIQTHFELTLKPENSEFDEAITSSYRQQHQLANSLTSAAHRCQHKSLHSRHASADADALLLAGMAHKTVQVTVSTRAFKRLMQKAEKEMMKKKKWSKMAKRKERQ